MLCPKETHDAATAATTAERVHQNTASPDHVNSDEAPIAAFRSHNWSQPLASIADSMPATIGLPTIDANIGQRK